MQFSAAQPAHPIDGAYGPVRPGRRTLIYFGNYHSEMLSAQKLEEAIHFNYSIAKDCNVVLTVESPKRIRNRAVTRWGLGGL